MDFGVAAQGQTLIPQGLTSHFFPEKKVSSIVNGALHINKAAIAARAKAAASARVDEEGLIARIIAAIREFFSKVFRMFGLSRAGHAENSDSSRNTKSETAPSLTETDSEFKIDGFSDNSLERMRETVDQLIDSASGETLPNSLRSALAMPEIGRRQAFRVLLQQNISDTILMRATAVSLREEIQQMVEPFAQEHAIDSAAALSIFRADLDGGGVIASRIDPESELRGRVNELKRLESALVGLAKHRGSICASAIDGGGYAREEIAALIAQQGFDTSFLYQSAPQDNSIANSVENSVGIENRPNNVVSLSEYREQDLKVSSEYDAEQQVEAVSAAIEHLVEEGVLETEEGAEILKAAVVDVALSDDAEFETELQGDDLDAFFKKREQSKPTMKI